MRQFLFSHHSSNYIGVAYSGFGVPDHWWFIPSQPFTWTQSSTWSMFFGLFSWYIFFGLFSQSLSVPDCILKIPCLLMHGFIRSLLLPLLYGIISWPWLLLMYGILPVYFQLRTTVRGSVLIIPSRSLIINIYFCNTCFLLRSNLYYICVDKNNCSYIWLCNL